MVTVHRSPHRWWWVSLVTIAGSMLAIADASVRERAGECDCATASDIIQGGSVAPLESLPVRDRGRITTTFQLTEPAAAHVCSESWIAARIRRSPSLLTLRPRASHTAPRSFRACTAVRVVSRPRVRITRLQNGSILCCRQLPPSHIVAVPADANDDTASDDDDTSDDDDSWDNLNGDDDTDSPVIAWLHAMVPYIAPYCPREMSWIIPSSFPLFLPFQPLRC